jgi:hypothetical protein
MIDVKNSGSLEVNENKKSIMKKKEQFKLDSTLDTYEGNDLL